jgi:hypothetical protein
LRSGTATCPSTGVLDTTVPYSVAHALPHKAHSTAAEEKLIVRMTVITRLLHLPLQHGEHARRRIAPGRRRSGFRRVKLTRAEEQVTNCRLMKRAWASMVR